MDPATVSPEMMAPMLGLGLLPLLIFSLPLAIFGYVLGKQKGRNHIAWAVWGFIPFVNWFAAWYFIGATNLKLEEKLDQLLNKG